MLDKVLYPTIQILVNLTPSSQAQHLILQDYFYAKLAIYIIEPFELVGIPVLWWMTRSKP